MAALHKGEVVVENLQSNLMMSYQVVFGDSHIYYKPLSVEEIQQQGAQHHK
jgi:hypothetical protein